MGGNPKSAVQGGIYRFSSPVRNADWDRLRQSSEDVCSSRDATAMLRRGEKRLDEANLTPRANLSLPVVAFGLVRDRIALSDSHVWVSAAGHMTIEGLCGVDAGAEVEVLKCDLVGGRFRIHFLPDGSEMMIERIANSKVRSFVPLV